MRQTNTLDSTRRSTVSKSITSINKSYSDDLSGACSAVPQQGALLLPVKGRYRVGLSGRSCATSKTTTAALVEKLKKGKVILAFPELLNCLLFILSGKVRARCSVVGPLRTFARDVNAGGTYWMFPNLDSSHMAAQSHPCDSCMELLYRAEREEDA